MRIGSHTGNSKSTVRPISFQKTTATILFTGGIRGFDKVVWEDKPIQDGLELTYVSKDKDQGFPGTLTTTVR